MRIGRNVRSRMYSYEYEVEFCKKNGFDFLQVWYENGKLELLNENNPEQLILNTGFPCIIHAMIFLNNNFDVNVYTLLDKVKQLGHKEVIVHASLEEGDELNIDLLHDKINKVCELFNENNIVVHLENNDSSIKGMYYGWEFEKILNSNPNTEILLDVVHALANSNYEKIQEYTNVKQPKILHVADTKLDGLRHSHLSIGKGEVDYIKVFNKYIPNYIGSVIFEMLESDEELIKSIGIIKYILNN